VRRGAFYAHGNWEAVFGTTGIGREGRPKVRLFVIPIGLRSSQIADSSKADLGHHVALLA